MRYFGVGNCIVWLTYNAIILSTAFFSQLFSLCSTLIAIYRYRKPKAQHKTA